jgi:cytochrome P450
VTLGGHAIKPGTIVLASQWVTHRDPRFWPDPLRFDPARWLPGGHATDPARPKYAYYPFGGGPRNCIGESFAWTEAILVIATLAQRWKIRTLDRTPPKLIPTITLRPTEPVWATVEPRNRK